MTEFDQLYQLIFFSALDLTVILFGIFPYISPKIHSWLQHFFFFTTLFCGFMFLG